MTASWRPPALAAVLISIVNVGVATAQTVIVRSAPPGSTFELALNGTTVGSATANAAGEATLAIKNAPDTEKDVRVALDVCGKVRRVVLVERYGQLPAPASDCERKEIPGFFVMRPVTTFVLDVGGASPLVWLRQGPVPPEWLTQTAEESSAAGPRRSWSPPLTGLTLSGGGGFTTFRDVVTLACGNVADCSGKDFDLSYTVSAGYWLTRFLGAEASFVKPTKLTINGTGDTFHFNTTFDPRIYTIAGKAGVPLGPIRIYGRAGVNYHEATQTTTNTINDRAVTLEDGTTQTIPGGTQTSEIKTQGWSWLVGGGFEGWVGRRAAIYAEISRAPLKGKTAGGELSIDDRVMLILFGARVHIGG